MNRPTRKPRKAKPTPRKPRKPQKPQPQRVHTSLPPRNPEPNPHLCAAIQAHFADLFGYHRSLSHGSAADMVTWWHTALAEADAALIAAQAKAIAANNADVASLANGLSLDVKVIAHTEAKDAISHSARVLQFDAVAMAKRIEAAAAKHKNRGPRGHRSANRHLAYHCPVCSVPTEKPDGTTQWSNTIRASAADRVIMCAGRYGAQHEPALCEFDQSSQPDYRLADHAAGTAINPDATLTDAYSEAALAHGDHSRSQAQIAARKAKYAAKLAAPAPSPAPGSADDTSEFGF